MNLNLNKKNDSHDAEVPGVKKDDIASAREVGREGPKKAAGEIIPAVRVPKIESVNTDIRGDGAVFFVYNGHEWEAHQVLGVLSSCDLAEATAQYQHLVKTADLSTLEFYESAHLALIQAKSTRTQKR